MRFTKEHSIPVKDRRRRRRMARFNLAVAALGVGLAKLSEAGALSLFPEAWRPYIVGASTMCFVYGLYEKLEQHRDGQRYLQRLHNDAVQRIQDGDA